MLSLNRNLAIVILQHHDMVKTELVLGFLGKLGSFE